MARLLRTVAVHDFHTVSGVTKMLADFLSDHHGAMLSARAAEGDRQVALPFVNVVRQQVDEQVGDARDELASLREGANVLGDVRVASCKRTELGDEVRVGQKSDVEDEVGVLGHALTKSEAHAGDQDAFFRGLFLESLGDVGAKLVNIELGSVDDEIGDGADRCEVAAFRFERGFYR